MAVEVKLPRLGQGMESGTIVKWLKSEGDEVEKGEPLYELDTEKVTQEVEAEAAGVLVKIVVAEGEADVGRTVAYIGERGEQLEAPEEEETPGRVEPEEAEREIGAEKPAEAPAREAERGRGRAAAAAEAETEAPAGRPAATVEGGRAKASPLARRIARERGIDLASLSGTGPEGRIVAEDVERAAAAPPRPTPAVAAAPTVEVEVEKLSQMQRSIARRMTEAWQIPAFHLFVSVDMTRALAVREGLLALLGEGETRPTISDLVTKVAAAALMRHRAVNARFADDGIELHPTANIGIAVALPAGLVVPVISGCERKSVAAIAAERADLVDRARGGKLRQEDLEDGTFTISNLGMYGVERFTAVLNPPQAAILAVGAVQDKPVAQNGELVVRPQMDLMLTCDHRTLNGAAGAEFLATLKTLLEEPALAL